MQFSESKKKRKEIILSNIIRHIGKGQRGSLKRVHAKDDDNKIIDTCTRDKMEMALIDFN